MKDAELRGIVLNSLYEQRHIDSWTSVPGKVGVPGVQDQMLANICAQLAEIGLIDWRSLAGLPSGMAHITAHGIDVVEGNARPPIAISIDSSVTVRGSSNVQIGSGNVQHISMDVEKLIAAIDHSDVSYEEKAEAKSLLQRLVASPLLKSLLEGWAKRTFL